MLTFLEVISLIRPFLTRGHPSRGPRLVASAVSFIRLRSATACHCDSHLLGFRIELFDCAPMEIFVGGDYHWVGWGAVIRAEREEIANARRDSNSQRNALTMRARYRRTRRATRNP